MHLNRFRFTLLLLTISSAVLPWTSEAFQKAEESMLRKQADGLIYGVERVSGNPIVNHQTDLLEQLQHEDQKRRFIEDNKSTWLPLVFSFFSSIFGAVLGGVALARDLKEPEHNGRSTHRAPTSNRT
jgi:hypothetical protein